MSSNDDWNETRRVIETTSSLAITGSRSGETRCKTWPTFSPPLSLSLSLLPRSFSTCVIKRIPAFLHGNAVFPARVVEFRLSPRATRRATYAGARQINRGASLVRRQPRNEREEKKKKEIPFTLSRSIITRTITRSRWHADMESRSCERAPQASFLPPGRGQPRLLHTFFLFFFSSFFFFGCSFTRRPARTWQRVRQGVIHLVG